MRILFDSGASATIITSELVRSLKKKRTEPVTWDTKAGSFTTNEVCPIRFMLPAFHNEKVIEWDVYVDAHHARPSRKSKYDLIIGRDLMEDIELDIKFSDMTINWQGASIPMKNPELLKAENLEQFVNELFYLHDPDTTEAERIQQILDNKYTPADLKKIADSCEGLNRKQKDQLYELLSKFPEVFDGSLGTWKTEPVELELKNPDEKPYHAKPYPVPKSQEEKLKQEVERLCGEGVIRKINRSEWAFPAFTIYKPDGTLRSLANLIELNKRIKRKPYPLPKISEMLQKLEGFLFATTLDLNMGYYHILLSPNSSRLCTIVFPWGKYEYLRLPMGLCNSPDIFQEKINDLMDGLEFVRAYLDDVLIPTKNSFEEHLEQLEKVLTRLQSAGLKVNASKSKFCQDRLEYLGYVITRDGIQPNMKKVEAILKIDTPKTRKQLRGFIGLVNYYRDLYPKRSHILAPLSSLTSAKVKWEWKDIHQQAFDEMKRVISKETLMAFPDFNKPFDIHTDASKLQLGACISQEGRPIAFYSRKLNDAQTRYTTTERELLSIVETLKEFKTILWGHQITIYTDHENLTYKQLNSERVLRWRLFIEEYNPIITYIKGSHNIAADLLSRLPKTDTPVSQDSFLTCMAISEDDYLEHCPLTYAHLDKAQQLDPSIMKILQMDKTLYHLKNFHGGGKTRSLVCFRDKIVVPKKLYRHVTAWYHNTLCHPGINRTEETIGQHLWWPKQREYITRYVRSCHICQRNKRKKASYGHVPIKEAETIPWDKLCVDLIGPYKIRRKGKKDLICKAVTMIDPATGWFEIHEYDDKQSITVANIVEQEWFCRYPWPTQITFDRGSEFIGEDFQTMIRDSYGIKKKPITVRNPQANSVLERIHQVIANMVRTFELENNYLDEDDPWKGIFSAVAFAVRSTFHTTLRKSPGQLVFGRDMIFNVQHQADWKYIQDRKQKIIEKNNKQENKKRIPHTYKVGDLVLLKKGTENKYETPYDGPFTILQVNDNGTVSLKVKSTIDTYNIRRLYPYTDQNHGGECSMHNNRRKRKRMSEEN